MDDGQAFRGNGRLTPEQEDIRKLQSQVKRLEMEKDILENRLRAPATHRIETHLQLDYDSARAMAVSLLLILSRQKTRSRRSRGPDIYVGEFIRVT